MKHNYATPIVVKYGGSVAAGHILVEAQAGQVGHPEVRAERASKGDPILESLAQLHNQGTAVVLLHGGGPEIDMWLRASNIETRRVDGLRVTDDDTLTVTEAVLCGRMNKRIVRNFSALGARAVGISGEDGATLVARRAYGAHGEDLGYVGDITACDPALINLLLAANYLPVVAPLAVAEDYAHAYNVNADLAAAALAGALRAHAFVIVTNVARVRSDPQDPDSGIDRMSLVQAKAFAQSPACEGGMKPKIQAAIAAVEAGALASYICGAQPIGDILAGNATIVSK